jgi:hypothetical protein
MYRQKGCSEQVGRLRQRQRNVVLEAPLPSIAARMLLVQGRPSSLPLTCMVRAFLIGAIPASATSRDACAEIA